MLVGLISRRSWVQIPLPPPCGIIECMDEKFWVGSIAALGIIDYWAARSDRNTLSCTARRLFRTHTTAGKTAWVIGWVGLSAWLIPHIVRNTESAVESLVQDLTHTKSS